MPKDRMMMDTDLHSMPDDRETKVGSRQGMLDERMIVERMMVNSALNWLGTLDKRMLVESMVVSIKKTI